MIKQDRRGIDKRRRTSQSIGSGLALLASQPLTVGDSRYYESL